MKAYRREWMRHFVTREPRIFDANILTSLRGARLLRLSLHDRHWRRAGADRQYRPACRRRPPVRRRTCPGTLEMEIKIVLVLFFVANALLRFIWSHRLFGYCAILMASVPNDPTIRAPCPRPLRAAEINITATCAASIPGCAASISRAGGRGLAGGSDRAFS